MTTILLVLGGLIAGYALLLALLWRLAPDELSLRALLRILPDTIRLVARLARDRTLGRRVRLPLWLLAGYLALPIDLVPDVVPVLGYADDAVLVALVLRGVVRRAGPDVVADAWPGDPDGLAVLMRVLRLCA